jgi:hypothetical protein
MCLLRDYFYNLTQHNACEEAFHLVNVHICSGGHNLMKPTAKQGSTTMRQTVCLGSENFWIRAYKTQISNARTLYAMAALPHEMHENKTSRLG